MVDCKISHTMIMFEGYSYWLLMSQNFFTMTYHSLHQDFALGISMVEMYLANKLYINSNLVLCSPKIIAMFT